jgi:Ca2+-binding EF-hand superfamily protein
MPMTARPPPLVISLRADCTTARVSQIEAIRHQHEVMFEEADSDRNGKVTSKEFVSCGMMRESGLREAEVHQAFADLDTDASSDVSLDEWLASFDDTSRTILEFDEEDEYGARPTREEELEYLSRQFKMLDVDDDLHLRGGELASLASKVRLAGEYLCVCVCVCFLCLCVFVCVCAQQPRKRGLMHEQEIERV